MAVPGARGAKRKKGRKGGRSTVVRISLKARLGRLDYPQQIATQLMVEKRTGD